MKKWVLVGFISLLLSGCSILDEDVQNYQVYDSLEVKEILNLYGKNYEYVTAYFSNDEKGEEKTTLGETISYYRRHTASEGNYDFKIRFNSLNKVVDIRCGGVAPNKGYDWNIELAYKLSCLINSYYKGYSSVEYWGAYSFSDIESGTQTRDRSEIWNYVRTFPLTKSGYMAEYYDMATTRTMLCFDAEVGSPYFCIFYRENR